MDCLFCKIVAGEIPSKQVFEDENVVVFMDIFPINDGHVLVVPKKHYVSINDMTDQEYINYQLSFKKIYDKFTNNFGADGFTIVQNFGLPQDVKHLHTHIHPVYENQNGIKFTKLADRDKLDEYAEIIKNCLGE